MNKVNNLLPLDSYNKFLSQLTTPSVNFLSNLTGRPIIYCSLKRFDILKNEEDIEELVNNAEIKQNEDESLKDFLNRRNKVVNKPYKDILKEIYPDTVNLEPQRGITNKIDELTGLNRIEISEDYSYYKLWCSLIKGNQNTTYFRMDSNIQIILPAVEELVYKKNDKIIFDYNGFEYVYAVSESPETYLYDVFQLNLQIITDRPSKINN